MPLTIEPPAPGPSLATSARLRKLEALSGVVQGCRVLLAEDNPVNQAVASGMLELMGAHVTVAGNGREALDLLAAAEFDLLLIDCQMPVMDGFEATHAIRRGEGADPDRRLPIIALTANAVAGDRETCLAAGMDDYLSKPFTYAELHSIVAQWVEPARQASS
jgi:CheY-like chemotaxis protein